MIYIKTRGGGKRVVILEPGNLQHLQDAGLVKSPDGEIVILYTPDMLWFQEEALKRSLFADGSFDPGELQKLIDEGKDPLPVVDRPVHPTYKMNEKGGAA